MHRGLVTVVEVETFSIIFMLFEEGQFIEGKVIHVGADEVLLQIGDATVGAIPAPEMSLRDVVDPQGAVSLGEVIEALVLADQDETGRVALSRKRAQFERAWDRIEQCRMVGGMVSGPVTEVVPGGLIVDIGLPAYMPRTYVDRPFPRGDMRLYVGQTLEAKIFEMEKDRDLIVLSRRDWLDEIQKKPRAELLSGLRVGETCTGMVVSLVNFGAFVKIGGLVEGLIPTSELSWNPIDHPSSVLSYGDEVQVQVLEVDVDTERILLSLKANQSEP